MTGSVVFVLSLSHSFCTISPLDESVVLGEFLVDLSFVVRSVYLLDRTLIEMQEFATLQSRQRKLSSLKTVPFVSTKPEQCRCHLVLQLSHCIHGTSIL